MLCWVVAFVTFLVLLGLVHRWYRRPYIHDYQSKSIFITGTDTGFGHELALALDRKGVKVYAGCYTQEGAENLAKVASSRLKTLQIDVTNKDTVVRAKEFIEKDLPPGQSLWGVVNNAGVLRGYTLYVSTLDDYKICMAVNFLGVITVTDTFLPLIKRSSGRVVNVISIAGRSFAPFLEPYACSKHATEAYTNSLRVWLKHYGVHVAAIEPGAFNSTSLYNTPLLDKNIDMEWQRLPDSLKEEYGPELEASYKKYTTGYLRNPPYGRYNNPKMVTRSIQHALFAKHPKDRYVCGYDARLVMLSAYIPDWLMYLSIRNYFPYF